MTQVINLDRVETKKEEIAAGKYFAMQQTEISKPEKQNLHT